MKTSKICYCYEANDIIYMHKIRPPQTITDSSPWLEKLHNEVRHFEEHKIDVEKLLVQNREAERIRSQMVILERRVQVQIQIYQ